MFDHEKLDTETPRSRNNLNKMDTSKFPPLSPASPGGFLFPNQQPPFQPLIQPIPVGGDMSNAPESYQSLREKWESLKPLIQRVYMEENKPFPYLAGILRDEHGFQPTLVTPLHSSCQVQRLLIQRQEAYVRPADRKMGVSKEHFAG
jgi:hypothetical protein